MAATLTRNHIQEVEGMRDSWVKRIRGAVARQLDTVRDADPTAWAALMNADRDAWVTLVTQSYETVAKAFATHALPLLTQRAGQPDFDTSNPSYQAAYNAFIRVYLANHVGPYVDKVIASFKRDVAQVIADHKARKPTAREVSDPNSQYYNPDSPDYDPDMDVSAGVEPSLTDDANSFLSSSIDLIAEMIAVMGSNLGPMASATAYQSATDTTLEKSWSAVHDSKTRPDHADADGQTVALDEPFQVGDSQLMFPCDESLGANIGEIIYCRCVVTYDVAAA